MKLTHPQSEHVVETDNPSQHLSQGWVEVKAEPKPEKPADK